MNRPQGCELGDLPEPVRELVEAELGDDELLWLDQPDPGRFVKRQLWVTLLGFALNCLAVARAIAIWDGLFAGFSQLIPTVLALALGTAMLTYTGSRYRTAQHTAYALTTSGAIVVSPPLVRSAVASYPAELIGESIAYSYYPRTGTIQFFNPNATDSTEEGGVWFELIAIRDVLAVRALAESIPAAARQPQERRFGKA